MRTVACYVMHVYLSSFPNILILFAIDTRLPHFSQMRSTLTILMEYENHLQHSTVFIILHVAVVFPILQIKDFHGSSFMVIVYCKKGFLLNDSTSYNSILCFQFVSHFGVTNMTKCNRVSLK